MNVCCRCFTLKFQSIHSPPAASSSHDKSGESTMLTIFGKYMHFTPENTMHCIVLQRALSCGCSRSIRKMIVTQQNQRQKRHVFRTFLVDHICALQSSGLKRRSAFSLVLCTFVCSVDAGNKSLKKRFLLPVHIKMAVL